MSNLKVANITADKWMNSDGSENYKILAWVRFDGTGTPTIIGAGNVSTIVDNGTGNYTVNFAQPLKSATASFNLSAYRTTANNTTNGHAKLVLPTTASVIVRTMDTSTGAADYEDINILVVSGA